MPTIKTIDRMTAKLLSEAMEKALQTVAAEYGVSIQWAGGSIVSDVELKHKFLVKVTDAEASAAAERKEFEMGCFLYDLKPEHYGAEVTIRSGKGKLVGFAHRREKFPIKVRMPDGKMMLATEAAVRHLTGKPDPNADKLAELRRRAYAAAGVKN